jgi:hypothetical protein
MFMISKKRMVKIIDMTIYVMAIATLMVLIPNACNDQVKATVTYSVNEPVYMSFGEFRAARPLQQVQAMENPGKICLYGDYLFINEIEKGIHVVDNRNPASPQPVAFIELLGNIDIAVKGNLLYADSYIDLVWFDVSNPAQPVAGGRLENVFRHILPSVSNDYPVTEVDFEKGVIVGWNVKTITEEEDVNRYRPCLNCMYDVAVADGSYNGGGGSTTMTGSMARFAVYGDYLYVVHEGMLKVFLLSGNRVTAGSEQYLTWNVETIFAYEQKLFLGTTSGLLIYDITQPDAPAYLSSLNHVVGCDPVVVQGDYAYVTVRGGNACGQNLSLLEVVDISNPAQPFTKASFDMASPYGLGIDGNILFVCDEGLKVFNAAEPQQINSKLLSHFSNIAGFDVIPYNGILMLIGSDGLYQYDYSDIKNIKQLSVLSVQKTK